MIPQQELSPLRYRGYYWDSESGFYYLQSRYYDPQIGRFINADQFASTGQGFLGYNMFAYCNNNPINCRDDYGYSLFPSTNQINDGGPGYQFSSSVYIPALTAGVANAISTYVFSGDFTASLKAGLKSMVETFVISITPNLTDIHLLYYFISNSIDAWSNGANGNGGFVAGLIAVASSQLPTINIGDNFGNVLVNAEVSLVSELLGGSMEQMLYPEDTKSYNPTYTGLIISPKSHGGPITGKVQVICSSKF